MLAKGWRGTIHWGSPGTGTEQGWPQRPPGRRTAVAAAAGGRLQAAASRPPGYRLRSRVWLIGPLALYGLLRIPSFLEPHWYTDEAGYVTTARALLQGKVLYSQIWTNKPPLHIWTVAAVIQLLGTSEVALHALTFLTGLLTLLAIAFAADRLLGRRRTVVALVLAAVMLGTPLLDAELILPESLLIVPMAWAGALLLTRVGTPDTRRWPLWPVAVGALAAGGIAYQQTALADTFAFGLILATAGRASWRRVATFAATVAGLTAAWLIPALVTAGAGKVAYALVDYWVQFSQGQVEGAGQGSLPIPIVFRAIFALVVLGLVVSAAWLHRRDPDPSWALWVWAAAALLVPVVALQPYPHYLLPSLAPTALALSSLGLRLPAEAPSSRRLGRAGLIVATGLGMVGAAPTGLDWAPAFFNGNHGFTTYYAGAFATLTRGQSLTAYQDQFDYRVPEDGAVAAWIKAHGLDGSSAVVWSADAWLYDMNDLQLLLPTPPIYNDEHLVGYDGPLAQKVADLDPAIVITEGQSRTDWPEIDPVVDTGYTDVDESGSEIVWLRDALVASVMGPPGLG
jgi:4-amino-4-deoxy-L-arabinose transferase-like glycosyltransferase